MSGLTDLKPETVRNRILDAVKNRLENIVDESFVRFDATNGIFRFMDVDMVGVNPAGMEPRVFVCVATGIDELTITEWFKDQSVPSETSQVVTVTSGTPFTLSDTGHEVTITMNSVSEFELDDSFEIRLNNSIFSIKGVYRWERVRLNKSDPSLVIFPQKETKKAVINDRYSCTLDLAITLWIDADPEFYSLLEEYIGEVLNELSRDIIFGECLNYDSEVTEVEIVDADGTSENVGAYIGFRIYYRHSISDTREVR